MIPPKPPLTDDKGTTEWLEKYGWNICACSEIGTCLYHENRGESGLAMEMRRSYLLLINYGYVRNG